MTDIDDFGLAPIKREGSLIWMDPTYQKEWQEMTPTMQDIIQKWINRSTGDKKKPFSIMPNFLRGFFEYAHRKWPSQEGW